MVFLENEERLVLQDLREVGAALAHWVLRDLLASREREVCKEWQDQLDHLESLVALEILDHLVQLEKLELLE